MEKKSCPFGKSFRQKRKELGVSSWRLCLALQWNPRNLQRIETGQVEPSILVAIQMLNALGDSAGSFFQALANDCFSPPDARSVCQNFSEANTPEKKGDIPPPTSRDAVTGFEGLEEGTTFPNIEKPSSPLLAEATANSLFTRGAASFPPILGEKKHFGALLKEARLSSGISQKKLSEISGYHLRNLTNVENKGQNPGVMTVLKLACHTGCNLEQFFSSLQKTVQTERNRNDLLVACLQGNGEAATSAQA